ncbi:MAG: glycine/sarcosine/betaine reductase selenoprotein B family protein [Lachnoclostridium sp.]
MFKNQVYMISTKNNAAGMRDAVKKMAPLALSLQRRDNRRIREEGYAEWHACKLL